MTRAFLSFTPYLREYLHEQEISTDTTGKYACQRVSESTHPWGRRRHLYKGEARKPSPPLRHIPRVGHPNSSYLADSIERWPRTYAVANIGGGVETSFMPKSLGNSNISLNLAPKMHAFLQSIAAIPNSLVISNSLKGVHSC